MLHIKHQNLSRWLGKNKEKTMKNERDFQVNVAQLL